MTIETGRVLLEGRRIGRRAPANRADEDGAWLLHGISLAVAAGERIAVVGPSGAGKTLLLRALALLDPIDEGEVLWREGPVADRSVPAFRRQVLYLHQRPALLTGSVEANLRLPFGFAAAGGAYDRARAAALLDVLGRGAGFMAKSTADLSGGEAQITALLRAIQMEPTVLLLDEPTVSLDADAAAAIERLVGEWFGRRPAERALVWVSHDAAQAGRVSDRSLRLAAGRLAA